MIMYVIFGQGPGLTDEVRKPRHLRLTFNLHGGILFLQIFYNIFPNCLFIFFSHCFLWEMDIATRHCQSLTKMKILMLYVSLNNWLMVQRLAYKPMTQIHFLAKKLSQENEKQAFLAFVLGFKFCCKACGISQIQEWNSNARFKRKKHEKCLLYPHIIFFPIFCDI